MMSRRYIPDPSEVHFEDLPGDAFPYVDAKIKFWQLTTKFKHGSSKAMGLSLRLARLRK